MTKSNKFTEIFESLEDSRMNRTQKHPFISIISIGFLGALSGIDSFLGLQDYAEANEEWLKQIIDLPKGVLSHDTIGRVFSMINVKQFHDCFFNFTKLLKNKTDGVIAIDGKTMIPKNRENPLHVVSAWSEKNKLVLGQVKINNKSNEIAAIPKVLDLLDIEGHIVTIDAMGCQKDVASQIISQKGEYLLALKGNQKSLHEDVKVYFDDNEFLSQCSYWEELDKGHGRIEKRQCWTTSNISWLKKQHNWIGLKSIAIVKSERTLKNKKTFDTRFYISSLPDEAEKICNAARNHWGIENKLHWTLDVVFNEDRCQIRKDNAPEVMGIMRKWALNVLNKTKGNISLRRAMNKCCMSKKYICSVLQAI